MPDRSRTVPALIGKNLGPYRIRSLLGTGDMGEVYLGDDTSLGRQVAIKVLPAEVASDPYRLDRFEQEARAAAALNHVVVTRLSAATNPARRPKRSTPELHDLVA